MISCAEESSELYYTRHQTSPQVYGGGENYVSNAEQRASSIARKNVMERAKFRGYLNIFIDYLYLELLRFFWF